MHGDLRGSMKIEFKNEDKVNLALLEQELGVAFRIIQEPHTMTTPDGIKYYGYILELDEKQLDAEKDYSDIAAKHKPEFSTTEAMANELLKKRVEALLPDLLAALDRKEIISKLKIKLSIKG